MKENKAVEVKRIFNRKLVIAVFCAVIMLSFSFGSAAGYAEVITVSDGSYPADCVYVAGNPNLYPVEYYDSERGCFAGIMPELLEIVSEDTGLSFVYIYVDGRDKMQSELARNKQVELVTAFKESSYSYRILPAQYPVLSTEIDGKRQSICIGFTDIASEELQETILNAFKSIPESEKTSKAISQTISAQKPGNDRQKLNLIIAASVLILVAVLILMIEKTKRSRRHSDSVTDELTGLGNSAYYFYTLEKLVPEQIKYLIYVAFISLDQPGDMNTAALEAIQKAQKEAARRLHKIKLDGEYVSRLSDAAFTFIYRSENNSDAEKRIEEILNELNRSEAEDAPAPGAFRAGICPMREIEDRDGQQALEMAKKAYDYCAENGMPYHLSTREFINNSISDEKIRGYINKALENREFKIYFQFITEKESEKISGAEALSRWESPEMGLLNPVKYIDIMKETGSISRHDYLMFESVCSVLERWSNTKYSGLFLTCNFTRVTVSEEAFAERIKEISDRYSFDHGKLVLEITEDTVISDSETAAFNIRSCKKMGFKIAIDDMGSGFSAIADLYGNEVDMVKVERTLVVEGVTDKGQKLLDGLIYLAHNMNTKVLLEGVELQDQKEMVFKTDCDYIQGFYYSRVLPYEQAMIFLDSKM